MNPQPPRRFARAADAPETGRMTFETYEALRHMNIRRMTPRQRAMLAASAAALTLLVIGIVVVIVTAL